MKISLTTGVLIVGASLCQCFTAQAHDLRGLDQHAKYKKLGATAAAASLTLRQESYHSLRSAAEDGVSKPTFDLQDHFTAKGFAGSVTSIVFGIAKKTARWDDQRQLTVCFFDGPAMARNNVMAIYGEVLSYTTLSAVNVGTCSATNPATIRVSFSTGEGYWSFIGTESQTIKQSAPTMGLDGLGVNAPLDEESKGVIRHEILHSVGFEHEHQRPDVDCRFKSYAEIAKLLGWSEAQVKTNFERMKPSPNLLLTKFDRDSEMLYQLNGSYFADPNSPCRIREANNKLSPIDIATLKLMYPKQNMDFKTLLEK
ncbi:MAG: hypothetical protein JSR72_18990 [Proteobacteria bacterium]|nr:hypothetical protein [Pseudomonadota bacterium]